MARLPSYQYLIQQIGDRVVLFEDGTEAEVVRFDPADGSAVARAQKVIHDSDLSDEDKTFAHFWAGYYYAYLSPAEERVTRALDLIRKHGDTDGADHKQWVLAQVAALLSAGTLKLESEGTCP